jgi:hypothetical protein
VVLLSSLAAGLVWWNFDDVPIMPLALWMGSLPLKVLLVVWIAWESCHSFSDLRRSGALELLLTTPLRVPQILHGQERALLRIFLGPLICVSAVELFFLAVAVVRSFVQGGTEWMAVLGVGALLVGIGLTLFVLDALAVARVGMWLGLVSGHALQAWGRTVLWVQLLPLLLSIPVLPVILCCGVATPVLLAAKSILFFTWAGGKLQTSFRATAARPCGHLPMPWWRWSQPRPQQHL